MKGIKDLIRAGRERKARAIQKAVADVLEGVVPPWVSTGQPVKAKMDKAKLAQHWQGWPYTCSNRNAVAVSKGVLRLYAAQGDGEAPSRAKARPASREQLDFLQKREWFNTSHVTKGAVAIEEVIVHPFNMLMRNVNPHQNQHDLMTLLSLFLDNTGDAYWHIIEQDVMGRKIPTEIWTLPSQKMTIVPDTRKYIKGYMFGDATKRVALRPDQVIHFLRPDINNYYYGKSRIEGAYQAVTASESYETYERYITENMGIKDMIVHYKGGTLDAKRRRELMAEWGRSIRLAGTQRAPMIADEDFEIDEAAWSPKDITFGKGRELRKSEIISAFGQHEAMYDKSANVANIERAIYIWEKYEIEATLTLIEQKLNEQLIPRYGEPRLFCAFDPVVGEDKEFALKQEETDLKNAVRTINEVRQLRGDDPVEWGDVPIIEINKAPLGSAPTGDGGSGVGQPKFYLRPKHTTTAHTPDPGGASFLDGIKADGTVDPEVLARTGGPNPPMTTQQEKLGAGVKAVWAAQTTLALQEAVKEAAADFTWVASEEWAQEIVKLSKGALGVFIEVGAQRGAEQIGVSLIDFIEMPSVQDYIENHTFKFAQAIGESSQTRLQNIMARGIANGDSIPQLQERIKAEFKEWSKSRVERVARYESSRALEAGKDLQWKESGVVAAKQWDAMDDACPFCRAMDGTIIPLGTAYIPQGQDQWVEFKGREIKLSHNYEEVIGGDLHPNCRCSQKPILIEG